MKKYFYISALFLIIIISVFYVSCLNLQPKTNVAIEIENEISTANQGDSLWFVYTLIPDQINNGELGDFLVTFNDETVLKSIKYNGYVSVTDSVLVVLPKNTEINSSYSVSFKATDGASGLVNIRTLCITIKEKYPDLIIQKTAKTLNYNSYSSSTQFGWKLDSDLKDVLLTNVEDTESDFVFFYNEIYRQQILSPDAQQIMNQEEKSLWKYSITDKKNTKIEEATEFEFNNATPESINNMEVKSQSHPGGGNGVHNVIADEYYKFELSDGRKGIFKVVSSNPPKIKSPYLKSAITIQFIWQETHENSTN